MAEGRVSTEERRSIILDMVRNELSISVVDIVARFNVSEVTARNDLTSLAKMGKVRRTRGGACAIDDALNVSLPELRIGVNSDAKRAIGRKAAHMVREGELIAVDAGTTALEFVKSLSPDLHLTLVTYDLAIAMWADSNLPNVEVIMPGGVISKNCRYLVGPMVRSDLLRFHFDRVFLGADTFSSRQGFGTQRLESADIKECMIRQAHWHAVLIDSSKVTMPSPVRFATLEDIDAVIMDEDPGNAVRLSIAALVLDQITDLILVGRG